MADPTRTAEIAQQVRVAMTRNGISGTQLGERIGLSKPTIQRRVRGESEWTAQELELVAGVLGVPVADLYERPGTTTPTTD